MCQNEVEKSEPTDVAALSAGEIAVVVTLLLGPGEWGIMNVASSFTLSSIILGYVWKNKRSVSQRIAVATSLGLVIFPGIAFFIEAFLSTNIMMFIMGKYKWLCSIDPCSENGHESRVHASWLFLTWLSVSFLFFVLDTCKKK